MTKRVTISTLDNMKASGDKFVMITAYDATFAKLASEAGADTILVGSVAGCHGLPHGVRGQG
jgi:3-methyl-2-oxobutanoate hydroxymethyltransferase